MIAPIYVVSSRGDVARAFAHREDAETIASNYPDARIRRHIAGFGIDETALDAEIRSAIERVRRLSHDAPMESAGGRAS